jgi:hypothetical protein
VAHTRFVRGDVVHQSRAARVCEVRDRDHRSFESSRRCLATKAEWPSPSCHPRRRARRQAGRSARRPR